MRTLCTINAVCSLLVSYTAIKPKNIHRNTNYLFIITYYFAKFNISFFPLKQEWILKLTRLFDWVRLSDQAKLVDINSKQAITVTFTSIFSHWQAWNAFHIYKSVFLNLLSVTLVQFSVDFRDLFQSRFPPISRLFVFKPEFFGSSKWTASKHRTVIA